MMSLNIALDHSVLRAYLLPVGGGKAWEATAELQQLGATLYVPPAVIEQISANDSELQNWREARLVEIQPDEFLRGCAAGMARRYLDYHPDPGDCRVVAEAECAHMQVLLTLNEELISGLGGRVESIRIETPWQAAARCREAAGAGPTDATRPMRPSG